MIFLPPIEIFLHLVFNEMENTLHFSCFVSIFVDFSINFNHIHSIDHFHVWMHSYFIIKIYNNNIYNYNNIIIGEIEYYVYVFSSI